MLPEGSNRQDRRFVQALSLDLDGVSQALRIEICYAARCHGAQFSIFVNFRQLSVARHRRVGYRENTATRLPSVLMLNLAALRCGNITHYRT